MDSASRWLRFLGTNPVIYAVAASAFLAAATLLPYFEGRAGRFFDVFLLPLGLVPWLLSWFFGLATLVVIGTTLVAGRSRRPAWIAAGLLLCCLSWWLIGPGDLFLVGLRHRILAQITAQDLRHASTLLPAPENQFILLDGPSQFEQKGPSRGWRDLVAAEPAIANLDPEHHILIEGGVVEIYWGGALTGHFGIRVQAPAVARDEQDTSWLSVAPDIALYRN